MLYPDLLPTRRAGLQNTITYTTTLSIIHVYGEYKISAVVLNNWNFNDGFDTYDKIYIVPLSWRYC